MIDPVTPAHRDPCGCDLQREDERKVRRWVLGVGVVLTVGCLVMAGVLRG